MANKFWDWFLKNNQRFLLSQLNIEEKKDALLDEFLDKLHTVSNNFYFQIGGKSDKAMELIISAEGDKRYFIAIERFVALAPSISEWSIIALKPPSDLDFITNAGGIEINVRRLWFIPLENTMFKNELGVKIFFEKYSDAERDKYLFAAHQILDTILGEKEFALNISYVDAGAYANDNDDNSMIEIARLKEYLSWKKNRS